MSNTTNPLKDDLNNYIPYGKEWEDEMMKMPKKGIIQFLRVVLLETDPKKASKESNTDCSVEQAAKDYGNQVAIDRWTETNERAIAENAAKDFKEGAKWSSQLKPVDCSVDGWISLDDVLAFGKRCFYKGYDKCEADDANSFTAWRETAKELISTLPTPPNTEAT